MFFKAKFPYMAADAEPSAGGTAEAAAETEVVDRGDDLEPPADTSGDGAAGEAAASALLEKELGEKSTPNDDASADDKDKDVEKDAEKEKKDTRIPLDRHEKILNRERDARAAVERELKRFQNGSQVETINEDITAAENSVLAMEKDYAKLIADGETDKAVETMSKIRRTERGIVEAKSDLKIQVAVARAAEESRYNVAVERIEAQYPQLNPDHDDFDLELSKEVREMARGYELQNYTPTEAVQKAVRKELGAATAAQEKAVSVAPRVATPAVTPAVVAQTRKKDALIRTAAAVEKSPPSITKIGADSDKMGGVLDAGKVAAMNQNEFAKLPDDVLAKLRGDEL